MIFPWSKYRKAGIKLVGRMLSFACQIFLFTSCISTNRLMSVKELSIEVDGSTVGEISPLFYGQNYWNWVEDWGGKVQQTEDQVQYLGVQLLRAGGINNDTNNWDSKDPRPHPFDNSQIDRFIAFTNAIHAKPLFQIPMVAMMDGEEPKSESIISLIRYLNDQKKYGVEYFSIGNEPDSYVDMKLRPTSYTINDYCTNFIIFSETIKKIYPNAKIIGPDLAWKYQDGQNDWFSPFLKACGSKIDIASIHYYGIDPREITEKATFTNAIKFRRQIKSLRQKMKNAGFENIPLAITEANLAWDIKGIPKSNYGPGTFYNALWIADVIGVGLEEKLFNISFWSLSQSDSGLGFYDDIKPRPTALIYRLMHDHFSSEILNVSGASQNVSVYAGRGNDKSILNILLINKNYCKVRINFTFSAIQVSRISTITIDPISLTIMEIDETTNECKIITYTSKMARPEESTLPKPSNQI